MKKLFFLLMAALMTTVCAVAQQKAVSGTVISADNNEPLVGVSVYAQGTSSGVITNLDGQFSITVPASVKHLTVSYVGYKTVEVTPENGMIVALHPTTTLDEVMVVAYGTAKKSEYTGSAGVVKADQLEDAVVSDVTRALAGRVAGLQTLSSNGQPGTSASVLIRGVGSINASSSPLYVVDGMPFEGDISQIAPSDIESMTVLKDAAATALYGARGANGVITITTKKGKAGDAKVTLNMSWGANSRALKNYDVISNPEEYMEALYMPIYNGNLDLGMSPAAANAAFNNDIWALLSQRMYSYPEGQYLIGLNGKINPNASRGWSDGRYYYTPDSWSKETFNHGLRQEYNLAIQGGNDRLNYYVSAAYLNDAGIIDGSHFDRLTTRTSVDYQAKSWLKIGTNMSYIYTDSGYPQYQTSGSSNSSSNTFAVVNQIAPIYPMYVRDATGAIMYNSYYNRPIYDYGMNFDYGYGYIAQRPAGAWGTANPKGSLLYDTSEWLADVLDAKWYAVITPIEGLSITGTVGYFVDDTRGHILDNNLYGQSAETKGAAEQSFSRNRVLNLQGLVQYQRTFADKHNFKVLVGVESEDRNYEYLQGEGKNLYMPGNWALNNTIDQKLSSGYTTSLAHRSGLINLNYNFEAKYFAQASFRRDGSSAFHPDNRWGNFWSASAAWDMKKEEFLKGFTALDMLKLKFSYGQNGNDRIYPSGYWQAYTDFFTISGAEGIWSDSELAYKGNKDITWEKSNNINAGFDFSFFNSRLDGSIEYYQRETEDMLFNLPVAVSNGYSSIPSNVGSMRNNGVEIDLHGIALDLKDVTIGLNANITFAKNKVTKLDPSILDEDGGWEASSTRYIIPGKSSMYDRYLVHYNGVDDEGYATYIARKDVKNEAGEHIAWGDEYVTRNYTDAYNSNRQIVKHVMPTAYGGFGLDVQAYGFDLTATFAYQFGGKIFDSTYQGFMNGGDSGYFGKTYHKDIFKAWTPENTNTDVPRVSTTKDYYSFATSTSDRFMISSDYISFNNLVLGYTIPQNLVKKMKLDKIRIYGAAENIALWSKRQGLDPRQGFVSSNNATYSPIRSITGGVQVEF